MGSGVRNSRAAFCVISYASHIRVHIDEEQGMEQFQHTYIFIFDSSCCNYRNYTLYFTICFHIEIFTFPTAQLTQPTSS